MLLSVRGLTVEADAGRGAVRILDRVDLSLARGRVLGIIGESGAGKSTLGLVAMGFVRDGCRITGGAIQFDGVDLVRESEERRRTIRGARIAYVAQSAIAAFNPAHRLIDQSIEVAVQHGLRTRADAVRETVDLYRRFRLPSPESMGRRYPHQVSGGQLQRVMTAMAMIVKPDLVIFDEPTTALDVTTQIEVLAAIREAVESIGTSAIYISHDLALVAQMADRIMVMRAGRVVEEGDTAQILNQPQESYTRALLSVRRRTPMARRTPAAAEVPLLSVKDVTAAYGATVALQEVAIDIGPGSTVAVVGESGSGKSTLARVITGLIPPRRGRIEFEGRVLSPRYDRRTKEDLRGIQMIVQTPDTALNPRLKVSDAIGRPLEFYFGLSGRVKERRLNELLEEIELDPVEYGQRFPDELSGGQRQRVCIARALAAAPRLLICDEATSALDQLVAGEILKLLDRLQRERSLAYLFITHDLSTVRAIADEVVVMRRGRVVDAGSRARILAPPYHPYTELLLSSVPEMDPSWLDRVLQARGAASTETAAS
ncbi:MAG: ABC transporter ATP-binding protein [Proteobacteria bacterium]|nr:ABC transporter ATP-binding protein [Pseudomonadota bacterium]